MRAFIAFVLFLVPFVAVAQNQAPSPTLRVLGDYAGLTTEDRNTYCFWAGELYSIGAAFCSRQQTLTTCTEVAGRRPVWVSKDNDKLCDKNLSMTPQ